MHFVVTAISVPIIELLQNRSTPDRHPDPMSTSE